jgi:hypothetical protein
LQALIDQIWATCRISDSAIASTSRVIATSSPTTLPPRSMGAFQLTPKWWRLIAVVATKPMRLVGPRSLPPSQ